MRVSDRLYTLIDYRLLLVGDITLLILRSYIDVIVDTYCRWLPLLLLPKVTPPRLQGH